MPDSRRSSPAGRVVTGTQLPAATSWDRLDGADAVGCEPMTIREYVEGRAGWIRIIGGIWVVGALIVMIVVFPSVASTNTVPRLIAGIVVGIVICSAFAALTKCPRCGASLGDMTYTAPKPFTDDMPDHCPKCGVSLDEPMESPAYRQ
jgi:hypothetical protein